MLNSPDFKPRDFGEVMSGLREVQSG